MNFSKVDLIKATNLKVSKLIPTDLGKQADNLFVNAIHTTLIDNLFIQNDYIFLSTGDIPAMWLRDSAFQALPFVRFATKNSIFSEFIKELVKSQCRYIQIDPYANAFNISPNNHHFAPDKSNKNISSYVWERKFELDSLCAPIYLAYGLFEKTKDVDQFNNLFWGTVKVILNVLKTEQHHEKSDYYFIRQSGPSTDTLKNGGKGTPIKYTGMVWSGFRPSDDACTFGYSVSSNIFTVVVLRDLKKLLLQNIGPKEILIKVEGLIDEITKGILEYGLVNTQKGELYAYEVDGMGQVKLMDDANLPNLLSIPYLKFTSSEDKVYQTTKSYVLSKENPYFFQGKYMRGVGSSHTPKGYVWPISIATEGLVSDERWQQKQLLKGIVEINGDKGCHESIDVNNLQHYTRESFSWADMMYCLLYLKYIGYTR